MYMSVKKEPRKSKEKTRQSIDDGIPEVPKLSDFQVTCLNEDSTSKSTSEDKLDLHTTDELDQNKEENGEEKKEKNKSEKTEIEGQTSSLVLQEIEEHCDLESDKNLQDLQNQATVDEFVDNSFPKHEIPIYNVKSKTPNLQCNYPALDILESDSLKNETHCDLSGLETIQINENNEPSAPSVEPNFSEPVTHLKKLAESKFSDSGTTVDIWKYNFTEILQDSVLPYSDEKLNEYYYNPELKESEAYVSDFISQEAQNESKKDSEFYKLLTEYMLVKNKLRESESKIKDLKENMNTCISAMWTVCDDVKATGKEKCNDGNIITFVQNYTQAHFNTEVFKDFASLFLQIKQEVYEVQSVDSFKCSFLKLKIEYFLQSLLTSCPEFTNLEEESPVAFLPVSLDSHFQQCLMELKIAISTLFMFQRKQNLDIDSKFLEETRHWLSDLVAVLLRVGSRKDHIFLLHHIMRCPGGVSDWATAFVQLPFSESFTDPFKNPQVNHMMSIMNIILSPIEQRENFIKKWESELTCDGNQWTVVDSDGEAEEDDQHSYPLKENDLVSLLNQIPFSVMFKAVLKCDEILIANNYGTFDYLLKLFSFLTHFTKILSSGLKLYGSQRYRQFSKRLGRLIYHIVQYATETLITVKSQISETEMTRIQIEYDNLFLKSATCIYSAEKHGTWQFMATMPYHMPSSNAIIKLYGILQLRDVEDERVVEVDFSKFSEKFIKLPEEEQFYLLTTFTNMSLARSIEEMQFIKNVLRQLMYIGFLNQSTKEHCYKNVRALLCSLCTSYPFLMSEILCIQKNMFESDSVFDDQLILNLWTKLPVEMWQPDRKDLGILFNWLSSPLNCVGNDLARLILQSLHYGMNKGELLISGELQYEIALMILQAKAKLEGNEAGVIKNVSKLVYQSPDQGVSDWAWNILLQLRLHLLDKSDAEMCRCFYNLVDNLQNIPNIESNFELHHLVLKNHPAACYVALMTTTLGHSVPIICEKGFELVDVLLDSGKYEAGLSCLEYMMMMFLDCSDSLHKCEKFISLLSRLIAADNTYVQLAKNLLSNNFPGPILKCVESMMQHQLNRWKELNFAYFSGMIKLWLSSLTRVPQWTQEQGVLYLIDRLVQNSFFDGASMKMITAVLQELLEAQSPSCESKPFSSLVGWMNSKYSPASLLPKGFNGEVPWFSYLVIHIEHELNERRIPVWTELLKELSSCSDKKINVDNSLKKVCNLLRIPVRSSGVLAIYKWAYQILETDSSHPLLPLIWQRFFSLYFYRVSGLKDRGSVGDKFFDGVINQGLLKRLKAKLQETCDYFDENSKKRENDEAECCSKYYYLFQTFSLWLHDPNLHKPCLSLHLLSMQYNPELFGLLIHGSETPWIEYLKYQTIERNLKNTGIGWLKLKNRSDRIRFSSNQKEEKLAKIKLSERLDSYENPLPPPRVDLKKYTFPRVNLNVVRSTNKMFLFVKPHVQVLLDYVKLFTTELNEHVSLACDMQELIPHMYVTSEGNKFLKGHCSGVNKVENGKNVLCACSGPAVIKLTYQESTLNNKVKQQFKHCWKEFDRNLEKATDLVPHNATSAAVLIDIAIEVLKHECRLWGSRKGEEGMVSDLKNTGVNLFDFLIETWYKQGSQVPVLEKTFENYVEVLAKSFIEDNAEANVKILNAILPCEGYGVKMCKYFNPHSFSTNDFIKSYSKAIDCLSEKRFSALSKFDINKWLSERRPRFSERSHMISVVGKGIMTCVGASRDQMVLKKLNHELEVLLMYDFPEHYGEVLNFLLEASKTEFIPTSTWFTFLNALALGHFTVAGGRTSKNIFEPGQPVKKLKQYFSMYAAQQNLLSFEDIKGTITLLASFFKAQRLKMGTLGLYWKYRGCIEPVFIFFGMLSYSFVTKAVEIDTGSLSDKLAQQLWPFLSDLYSPWLVPYWVENRKEQTPPGLQDLNSELSVVLPWLLNDSCHASFCASVFTESIKFLFDALPGSNNVLSYAWFFYVNNFAHVYIKDYVLNVIHESLLSIPWEAFFPSLQDVESMLKVVDQFLPLSHSFLGNLFINIKWTELVHYFLSTHDLETATKLHICLLHLLVKLPLEPSLKQSDKVIGLLTEANGYAWHLVDSFSYEIVLNWFIMSCDPRIILKDERLDYYEVDSAILRLLQVCAGHVPFVKLFHPTTLSKRLIFVRACVKWLINSNRRFKSRESPLFKSALVALWTDIETVLSETTSARQRLDEAGALVSEFLTIFSEADLCPLIETILTSWLSTTRKSQAVVFGLFRSAGPSLENPKIFGSVLESSLENYFDFSENCNWNEVTDILAMHPKSEGQLEKVLIDNNYFLTLYGVLIKRLSKKETNFCSQVVLTDLLQLLSEIKLSNALEPKLFLLIILGFELSENEIKNNTKEGIMYLVRFFNQLKNYISEKGNWFFSAIGLKKSGSSNRFRLACLVACSGIAVFIKTNYPEYQDLVDETVLQALEVAEDNKIYQNIQQYASYAKTAVKNSSSVQHIVKFLKHIGFKLFNKLYLK